MHTLCKETNDPKWINEASLFSKRCHNTLLSNHKALWSAFNLGLTFGTIQDLQLGWNSHCKLLPEGLVVPTLSTDSRMPIKLTIYPEGEEPFVIPGSKNMAVLYGNTQEKLPLIIVESQLEAILFHQCAGDIAHFLATDTHTLNHSELIAAQGVLFAIDNHTALEKWKSVYPNIIYWKSLELDTDPFTKGMKIRKWVLEGVTKNTVNHSLLAYHQ